MDLVLLCQSMDVLGSFFELILLLFDVEIMLIHPQMLQVKIEPKQALTFLYFFSLPLNQVQ